LEREVRDKGERGMDERLYVRMAMVGMGKAKQYHTHII
jgi:hypothetical protein